MENCTREQHAHHRPCSRGQRETIHHCSHSHRYSSSLLFSILLLPFPPLSSTIHHSSHSHRCSSSLLFLHHPSLPLLNLPFSSLPSPLSSFSPPSFSPPFVFLTLQSGCVVDRCFKKWMNFALTGKNLKVCLLSSLSISLSHFILLSSFLLYQQY